MQPVRIAMWSGPRNISTAMMRSFDARPDTFVTDEPLYAFYLNETGADHPGRDEVIAHYHTDWRKVIDYLTGPVPDGSPIWYQKHMTHHMLTPVETDWFVHFRHAFLIRDPADMLTSLMKVVPDPTTEQTGLPRQLQLFDRVRDLTGSTPPVIDAADVRSDPESVLSQLCHALDIPWTPAMLSWDPGRRPTDGVWAPHWYHNVEKSTGFAPYQPKNEPVPEHLHPVLAECEKLYNRMAQHRITSQHSPH